MNISILRNKKYISLLVGSESKNTFERSKPLTKITVPPPYYCFIIFFYKHLSN